MVCFDAGVLIDLFNDRLNGPRLQRILLLMEMVKKEKISIPAPAYAEFLTRSSEARDAYQSIIEKSSVFKVEPFSKRAAIECAIMLEEVFTSKQRRQVTKAKIKFDWMIVATAKALNATCMFTTDADIEHACAHAGLACVNVNNIQIPVPAPRTPDLFTHLDTSNIGNLGEPIPSLPTSNTRKPANPAGSW